MFVLQTILRELKYKFFKKYFRCFFWSFFVLLWYMLKQLFTSLSIRRQCMITLVEINFGRKKIDNYYLQALLAAITKQ